MTDNQLTRAADWRAYIQGDCEANEAERLERLLLEDDEALHTYLTEMDNTSTYLPDLDQPLMFTDNVMNALRTVDQQKEQMVNRKRRWYEKPIFHYSIAASITLVLLSSGAFDKMMPRSLKSDQPKEHISYSSEVMQATTSWLDKFKP